MAEFIDKLKEKGLDINDSVGGVTPLTYAAIQGNAGIVELLVDKGAKFAILDQYGSSPLHWASKKGNKEVVKVLLSKGADILLPNDKKQTPLALALENGKDGVVEILENPSKYINSESDIVRAIKNGNDYKLEILIDKYGVNEWKDQKDNTVLQIAITEDSKAEIIKMLIEKGAKYDIEDKYGDTILGLAIRSGNPEVVKMIIDKLGVNCQVGDLKETPLALAIKEGKDEIVEMLLKSGADYKLVDSDGYNALGRAGHKSKKLVEKILLTGGADASDQINTKGDTLLHLAVSSKDKPMINMLLAKGAKLDTKNSQNVSPLELANRPGRDEIFKMLNEPKNAPTKSKITKEFETMKSNSRESPFWIRCINKSLIISPQKNRN